ncbi:tetratricopeptide repeat protein [Neobacillus cucumis]|uniref:tetratricopeptide repeat protein n=1 Tax=Neobacillus cucumis TaxID=1740721 RepID=UPI002041F45E|nr:tetratricopeptide repeat protein [Neobacillus cucumis]MCM3729857.1 tetratricopeptide repeat protein [Neobacillus cucumis]
MITNNFIDLLEKQNYQGAMELFLEQFQTYIKQNKLTAIRSLMDLPEPIVKDLLTIMDLALMEQWSRILARHSYRKLKSPLTTIWYGEELIAEQKLIEAEELLKELERQELSSELAEKLYFNLAVALINMQRFREGFSYMEKCETASKDSMNTRWAYFYLQKGEWDTAIQLLEKGKKDQKDGALSYALLVQHYSMQGEMEKAERVLEEGLQEYPHYPKLLVEKIRFHYKHKQFNIMRESITELLRISPYHEYQKMCAIYEAEAYYEEEKLVLLQQHLTSHSELTKQTHYKHFNGKKNKPFKKINYKPVVQKYNFCVPACVQMALSMFSHEFRQEEIAASIFDVAGSRISKAIGFFEERGYCCRLFLGNEERFKKLIDLNTAVMVTIDYPTSSHVQMVTGYDDNLQVFHIQDPNFREPHQLEYQNLEKEFGNNFALSVAIVPASEADKLDFLDPSDHDNKKKLLLLTEECDHALKPEDLFFLKEHAEDPVVAAYSVRYLASNLDEGLLKKLVATTEHHLKNSHYRNLIIAMAYAAANNEQGASEVLDKAERKNDPTYHYLKGRLSYDKGDYLAASDEFKKGIKLEPDDYILWSYLAISTSNQGDNIEDALRFSKIALDINDRDVFQLINHGMILFNNEQYEEARDVFTTALQLNNDNAHIWYERALCDRRIGRFHKAERGFKVSIGLDPDYPLPYRELANLYEFAYEDLNMAEEVLKKGLDATDESYLLLMELGEFSERTQKLDQARAFYSRATEKTPEEPDAFLSLGTLLREEGKITEFFSYMYGLYDQFKEHNEFLINSGKIMWEAAIERGLDKQYIQQAMSYMEQGIKRTTTNLVDALDLYTGLIENSPFYRRGIEFLEGERMHRKNDDFLFLCYIGCLYEQNGYLNKAKSYIERALTMKENLLSLFRLGEIYFKSEEYEKAREYYLKVIKLDPSHEQSMLSLASIASHEGIQAKELHYLMEAFRINPYCIPVETAVELMEEPSMLQDFLQRFRELELGKKKYDRAFLYDSMAYIYGKLGDIKEEEAYLTKALELSPELPQLLHHRVQLLLKRRDLKTAKQECLLVIQEDFNTVEWYETLIDIYSETKSLTKLEADLKKLKLTDKEKSIVFMNSATAYEKVVDNLVNESTDGERKGLFKRLTGFTKLSYHMGVVISFYETAMKLDPENRFATACFSDFYLKASSPDEAIKVLEQSLKSQWDTELAYKLVTLYVNESAEMSEKKQMKALAKAESLMETLVAEYDEPEYMNLFGFILFLQGRLEEAEAVYVQCLKLEPSVDKGYLHLGKVYTALENYPEAEFTLKKALELQPNDPDALNELAMIYRQQGHINEALQCIDNALNLDQQDLYFKYNRACYLSLLGQFKESYKQLREVFELDEEGVFLEMSEDEEDFDPLKKSGLFPLEIKNYE